MLQNFGEVWYERISPKNEQDDFQTLISKLDNTTYEVLKLVESKTNNELYELAWYDKWPLGKMIQLNTTSPFKNAKDRIRKWKKMNQLH
jgi:hypothetical protein